MGDRCCRCCGLCAPTQDGEEGRVKRAFSCGTSCIKDIWRACLGATVLSCCLRSTS
ncbi:MAG: hypothetical protein MHM6MM_002797 [Cercozoa sp. M6MM]